MPYLDFEEIKDLAERKEYIDSISTLIKGQKAASREERIAYTLKTPALERREALRRMLGYPLSPLPEKKTITVKKTLLSVQEDAVAYRMQLALEEGLCLYGILLEPIEKAPKNALVIFQHGGWGYPEIISGLVPPTNYHDLSRTVVRAGACVFCPQIPYWREDIIGTPYSREAIDLSLRRVGGSLAALCVYGIERTLDYFLSLDEVDKSRVGIAGLSYGGMYALLSAALDERIRFALCSCFFNDRGLYSWQDMVFFGQEKRFFDAEVLTLVAPRPIMVETAKRDEIFDAVGAENAARDYAYYKEKLSLPDSCAFHTFDGKHEFATDGENLRFLKTHIEKED